MQNKPPMIVAEISCNHNQDLEAARELIDSAKWAGADAVKIQLYNPNDMVIDSAAYAEYAQGTPWDGQFLKELYDKACTPLWLAEHMFTYAKRRNIPLFSSVFSVEGLAQLEGLGCPMYKIASFENNDLELISAVAKTDKPLFVSTGMVTENKDIFDIKDAVGPDYTHNLTLMHCISAYPTYNSEANLCNIELLRYLTRLPVGFSDHTLPNYAAMAATALGATVIEKHLISSKQSTTLDQEFSINEYDLKRYITDIKNTWETVTSGNDPQGPYRQFKRSLYAIKDINEGDEFTKENVRAYRPYAGIDARYFKNIIGRKSRSYIPAGKPVKPSSVEGTYP